MKQCELSRKIFTHKVAAYSFSEGVQIDVADFQQVVHFEASDGRHGALNDSECVERQITEAGLP